MSTMPETPVDHKRQGIDLFNHVWDLLEKADRTPEEDGAMVDAAHASRHHWAQVGQPVNAARGDWQISRVYATVKRPEPALHHARRSLAICEANGIGDFDLAFAHEAIARAEAVAGHFAEAKQAIARARAAAEAIAKPGDRDWLLKNLEDIPLA